MINQTQSDLKLIESLRSNENGEKSQWDNDGHNVKTKLVH